MVFFAITSYCSPVLRLPNKSQVISCPQNSVSFRFSRSNFNRRKPFSIQSVSVPAAPASEGLTPAISLTDNALKHLNKMSSERNQDLCLRIGVKQGGCSGMSYTMDFEERANTRPDDSIIEYNGFVIVCDPKSLLFVFGMQLDYSDALIGGASLSRTLMLHKPVDAVNPLLQRCEIMYTDNRKDTKWIISFYN